MGAGRGAAYALVALGLVVAVTVVTVVATPSEEPRGTTGAARTDVNNEVARLASRPVEVPGPVVPETRRLGLAAGRDALLFVPGSPVQPPLPLLVMFHGAGGNAQQSLDLVREDAESLGVVVLAPESRGPTWDVIAGGWGPDVEFLDRALGAVFAAVPVDAERVVVGGFSDGASYAISIGLANGDLFRHVVALSPGFDAAPAAVGRPSLFVSHGVADQVLPINRTSRVVVPRLKAAGYEVDYVEFPGGHDVPAGVVRRGLAEVVSAVP